MKKYECPTCHQDMREAPHEGMHGEDCPQCGQGMFWRVARIHQRANTGLQADGAWVWDEKNQSSTNDPEWRDRSNYRPAAKA